MRFAQRTFPSIREWAHRIYSLKDFTMTIFRRVALIGSAHLEYLHRGCEIGCALEPASASRKYSCSPTMGSRHQGRRTPSGARPSLLGSFSSMTLGGSSLRRGHLVDRAGSLTDGESTDINDDTLQRPFDRVRTMQRRWAWPRPSIHVGGLGAHNGSGPESCGAYCGRAPPPRLDEPRTRQCHAYSIAHLERAPDSARPGGVPCPERA